MAVSYDFYIDGDHAEGRTIFFGAITSLGYSLNDLPDGGYVIRRGSVVITVLLGGLAGRSYQLQFSGDFGVSDEGALIARLHKRITGSTLLGGALGASKTENAFVELIGAVTEQLSSNGVLLNRAVV